MKMWLLLMGGQVMKRNFHKDESGQLLSLMWDERAWDQVYNPNPEQTWTDLDRPEQTREPTSSRVHPGLSIGHCISLLSSKAIIYDDTNADRSLVWR